MITNQFKRLLVAFDGTVSYTTVFNTVKTVNSKNNGPNLTYYILTTNDSRYYYNESTAPLPKFIIGSGGGAETPDSYTLEEPITSVTSFNSVVTFTKPTLMSLTLVQSLTNREDTAKTIREVGFIASPKNENGSYLLVDRTLLKEPVTIAPNETKTIQYTIDFSKI